MNHPTYIQPVSRVIGPPRAHRGRPRPESNFTVFKGVPFAKPPIAIFAGGRPRLRDALRDACVRPVAPAAWQREQEAGGFYRRSSGSSRSR
jgi:hypothetical protein